jgi:phage shock protein E
MFSSHRIIWGILIVCGAIFMFFSFSAADSFLTPAEARSKVNGGALLIDVRSAEEFSSGHLAGAANIPHTEIDAIVKKIGPDMQREVVLYCRSGRRSGIAASALKARGYTHVINAGGYAELAKVWDDK